jgi:hypothetical protein
MPLTAKGDEGSSDCPCRWYGVRFRGQLKRTPRSLARLRPRSNSAAVLGSISSAQGLRKALRRPHGLYVTQASPLVRFSAVRRPPQCKRLHGLLNRSKKKGDGGKETDANAAGKNTGRNRRNTWRSLRPSETKLMSEAGVQLRWHTSRSTQASVRARHAMLSSALTPLD